MAWSKKAWEGLKAGHVGNPRILALVLAVVAILAAWWFLARSNERNDSVLWANFDSAIDDKSIKAFTNEPTQANTLAGKIARFNDARLRKDTALRNLTASLHSVRGPAADNLEKLRDEFTELADQFTNDRTLKAEAYLAAADSEMALVGVPKKGVVTMGVDIKGNCRGQVERYVELKKKAAEAIGPTTDAGKMFLADAEKYSKETDAGELYRRLGTFHMRFNDPDPLPPTPEKPFDPTAPKAPDKIPSGDTP